MQRLNPPLRFDMNAAIGWARHQTKRHLSGTKVTLNLPFVSVSVPFEDRERKAARELVIRLRDKRVLSAAECCDDCIDRALASLGEVRKLLVEKQVELADLAEGPLFALMDAMTSGIRQFITYEERLRSAAGVATGRPAREGRAGETRQAYFAALEALRAHLARCLGQVTIVAGLDLPVSGFLTQYGEPWPEAAYLPPPHDTGD